MLGVGVSECPGNPCVERRPGQLVTTAIAFQSVSLLFCYQTQQGLTSPGAILLTAWALHAGPRTLHLDIYWPLQWSLLGLPVPRASWVSGPGSWIRDVVGKVAQALSSLPVLPQFLLESRNFRGWWGQEGQERMWEPSRARGNEHREVPPYHPSGCEQIWPSLQLLTMGKMFWATLRWTEVEDTQYGGRLLL